VSSDRIISVKEVRILQSPYNSIVSKIHEFQPLNELLIHCSNRSGLAKIS